MKMHEFLTAHRAELISRCRTKFTARSALGERKPEPDHAVGLGLSISRRSLEADGGKLSVRDVPGVGCIFTIDLPRLALPDPVAALLGDVASV